MKRKRCQAWVLGNIEDPHMSKKSPHKIQDEFQEIEDDMTYRA